MDLLVQMHFPKSEDLKEAGFQDFIPNFENNIKRHTYDSYSDAFVIVNT